jgi:hypothetical protein
MNRRDEYAKLQEELSYTPPALEYAVSRARARHQAAKRRRWSLFAIPGGSAAAFLLAFALAVNLSMPFAYAMGKIPGLRQLAVAVARSPSLAAAVENQFVQHIGQEQTADGITLRIEYVIVDQRQVNVFYTLRSDRHGHLRAEIDRLALPCGSNPEGLFMWGVGISDGPIRSFMMEFTDAGVPDTLVLRAGVIETGNHGDVMPAPRPVAGDPWFAPPEEYRRPEYAAEFEFTLTFDPLFTQTGETILLNQAFTLGGQAFTAQSVELYPTHAKLTISASPDNTAWLSRLYFHLEDGRGRRFEFNDGLVSHWMGDHPEVMHFRIESPFFSRNRGLTLRVTGADLLDKDARIAVNLPEAAAEGLPDGTRLGTVQRREQGWFISLIAAERDDSRHHHQIIRLTYHDQAGNSYHINRWSFSGTYDDLNEYEFSMEFPLIDYPYDVVYFTPIFTRAVQGDAAIPVR